MNDETRHWTSDHDLLERFVLGKIESQERGILEEHLGRCVRCRDEVERETRIAAEVRAFGRAELKARLQGRIAARVVRPGNVAWFGGLATAAVLVIAVGLGIYNGWFARKFTPAPALQEFARQDSLAAGSAARPELAQRHELLADREQAPAKSVEIQVSPSAGQGAGEGPAPVQGLKKGEPSTAISLDAVARSEQKGQESVVPQGVWLEGIEVAFVRGREAAAGAREGLSEKSRPSSVSRIELVQRPWQSLPLDRQQVQARSRRETVQSFFSRREKGLQLVLFFDPLIAESEWKAAVVSYIGEDSLAVQLPSRTILYRIPAGFLNVPK